MKKIFFKIKPETAVLLTAAFLILLIHLVNNYLGGYGIFRDEFYYIACSKRAAFGYVDHPPLSIWLLAVIRTFFGESLFAVRLLPALLGAATVYLTGRLTVRMGGRTVAVIISSICAGLCPIYLGMNSYYSMNSIDIFIWILSAHLILSIISGGSRENWIYLGIALGAGLLNKISAAWLAAGFILILFMPENRKYFKSSMPYIAALIAFALFLPFIIWNVSNGYPHLEFMRNASSIKYASNNGLTFILGVLMIFNPLTLPIWAAGIYFFISDKGRDFRSLLFIPAACFAILLANWHSKPEYIAPAFTLLFAAGGVQVEKVLHNKALYAAAAIALALIISAPMAFPCLPVQTYIKYAAALGMKPESNESKELTELPQFYADMFGWEDKAKEVSSAYMKLTPAERNNTLVFAQNYGQAAALEYYSSRYQLPPVICPHNNYWIWSRDVIAARGIANSVIVLGGERKDLLSLFESADSTGFTRSGFSMPYENNLTIYSCRKLKKPLFRLWSGIRHYI
jgi:hypothetical protein